MEFLTVTLSDADSNPSLYSAYLYGHNISTSSETLIDLFTSDLQERNVIREKPSRSNQLEINTEIVSAKTQYFSNLLRSEYKESLELKVSFPQFTVLEFLHFLFHITQPEVKYCNGCATVDLFASLVTLIDYYQADSFIKSRKLYCIVLSTISQVDCLAFLVFCKEVAAQERFIDIQGLVLRHCLYYYGCEKSRKRKLCESEDSKDYSHTTLPDILYLQRARMNIPDTVPQAVRSLLEENEPPYRLLKTKCIIYQSEVDSSHIKYLELTHSIQVDGVDCIKYRIREQLSKNPLELHGCSFCVTNNGIDLYVTGGEYGWGRGKWETQLHHYSVLTKRLRCLGTMNLRLRDHFTCTDGQFIYALKGFDRYRMKNQYIYKIDINTCAVTKSAHEIVCNTYPEMEILGTTISDDGKSLVLTEEQLGFKNNWRHALNLPQAFDSSEPPVVTLCTGHNVRAWSSDPRPLLIWFNQDLRTDSV